MACDVAVLGAGIIGLATAKSLAQLDPKLAIHVYEKEPGLGRFASGRNSGVLHAGFYNSPDSLKSKFCMSGNFELKKLISRNNIPILNCGKVVVTRSLNEITHLHRLFDRGQALGVKLEILAENQLRFFEPLAKTKSQFIWSPDTSVSDPHLVIKSLANECLKLGIKIFFNSKIEITESGHLKNHGHFLNENWIVNCAGGRSLNIAQKFGAGSKYSQMPFLGTYVSIDSKKIPLRTLVYPVPHPVNPFLGVHTTLTINGIVKIGPTAIPVLGPEQNKLIDKASLNDFLNFIRSTYAISRSNEHQLKGLTFNDVAKLNSKVLIKSASLLVPDVARVAGWKRYPAATRSQIVELSTGKLEQDFIIEHSKRGTHVLNAVSPGWTSSLAFGKYIALQVIEKL